MCLPGAMLLDAPFLLANIRKQFYLIVFKHCVLQPVSGLMLQLCPIRSFYSEQL